MSVPIKWRDAIYATNGRVLSWRAKAVAGPISTHMNKDGGSIWPSVELLAAETSLAERTVQKGLAELRGAGFLIVERQGGGRNRPTLYRAMIPPQTLHDLHPLAAKRAHRVRGIAEETPHVRSETPHVRYENPARRAGEDVQEDVQEDVKSITRANARGKKKRAYVTRSKSKSIDASDPHGYDAYDRA